MYIGLLNLTPPIDFYKIKRQKFWTLTIIFHLLYNHVHRIEPIWISLDTILHSPVNSTCSAGYNNHPHPPQQTKCLNALQKTHQLWHNIRSNVFVKQALLDTLCFYSRFFVPAPTRKHLHLRSSAIKREESRDRETWSFIFRIEQERLRLRITRIWICLFQ